jgi:hypothetical protein
MQQATLNTRVGYNGSTYLATSDYVFLLSEEEVFRTTVSGTPNLSNNVLGNVVLFADDYSRMATSWTSHSIDNYWLRSPFNTNFAALVMSDLGQVTKTEVTDTNTGTRPALVIDATSY